jgi:biopolymer transport protein ExbD
MKIGSRMRPKPDIPVIALADIAWQIIIFFLVASTFSRSEALLMDLPGKSDQPQAKPVEPVTVLAGENYLALNGQEVPPEELEGKLRGVLEGRKTEEERAVVLQSRGDLTFQHHADLLLTVQRAGGIVVLSEEE